ncbi:hypothetical protein ANN_25349 [Periplaneta americana]|uniref:DUF4817 domain-containing protein n=1 Tax=Periplaneta americana TaxID=6978 RepID=A0ABQ8S1F9_PERAM|nr:hypothetical protein ANN_25349 [Periplaneta americana]
MPWTGEERAYAVVSFLVSGNSVIAAQRAFRRRLISSRADVPWPARAPDLAPCDFFLWRHFKTDVFKHRPRTLPDLRNAIKEEIGLIPQEMLVRVMQNFRSRIQQCTDSEGHHLRDTIRNEAVLERAGEERMRLKLIRKRKRNWLGSLVEKKLPTEGCTGRNGEREKVED